MDAIRIIEERLLNGEYIALKNQLIPGLEILATISPAAQKRAIETAEKMMAAVEEPWRHDILCALDDIRVQMGIPC